MMRISLYVLTMLTIIVACNEEYVPKPRGYFRIDLPEKNYQQFDIGYPYSFECPDYSQVQIYNPDSFWVNVDMPVLKAKIHISYKKVDGNVARFLEESRFLVYKHTIKAEAINEKLYVDTIKNVYGVMYEIEGNAASALQFYMTDSVEHFMRGALYFNVLPNKDSLNPVIEFLKSDIQHLVETLEWTNISN